MTAFFTYSYLGSQNTIYAASGLLVCTLFGRTVGGVGLSTQAHELPRGSELQA